MAETVYVLCSLTSLACAVLLLRGYARSKARLLLWSGLCFVCLMANNVLLFLDKVVYPEETTFMGVYFVLARSVAALTGVALLVYGLVWDSE